MAKKLQVIGNRGKSAYQYALEGGYTGSEADFKEKMARKLEVTYDYDDLNEKILATTIKQDASGTGLIHVEDSAALPVMDFGLEGTTTQDGDPTPDSPVEITHAGVLNQSTGRYEIGIEVGNKNILNLEREYDVSGSYRGWKFKDDTTKFITISVIDKQNGVDVSGINFGLSGTGKDGSGGLVWLVSGGALSIPTYNHAQSNYFTIFPAKDDVLQKIKSRFDIQIEYGLVKTDYTPYASQPLTLTSPVPLTKWDKLVKRDGVYGWSVNSIKVTADGSVKLGSYTDAKGFIFTDLLPSTMTKLRSEGFCNQGKVEGSAALSYDHIFICAGDNEIYWTNCPFYDETLEDKGLANFKVHLNEHPLEIVTYADSEQSFHPLPDEEQALLKKIETYYGVTNITNDQNLPMTVKYIADPQIYIDNLAGSLTNAVVSLGGEV